MTGRYEYAPRAMTGEKMTERRQTLLCEMFRATRGAVKPHLRTRSARWNLLTLGACLVSVVSCAAPGVHARSLSAENASGVASAAPTGVVGPTASPSLQLPVSSVPVEPPPPPTTPPSPPPGFNATIPVRHAAPPPPVVCNWLGTPTPDGYLIVTAATASVAVHLTEVLATPQERSADLEVRTASGKIAYDYAAAHGGNPIRTSVSQPTTLTLAWQASAQLPPGDYGVSVPVMVNGQVVAHCNAGWRVLA